MDPREHVKARCSRQNVEEDSTFTRPDARIPDAHVSDVCFESDCVIPRQRSRRASEGRFPQAGDQIRHVQTNELGDRYTARYVKSADHERPSTSPVSSRESGSVETEPRLIAEKMTHGRSSKPPKYSRSSSTAISGGDERQSSKYVDSKTSGLKSIFSWSKGNDFSSNTLKSFRSEGHETTSSHSSTASAKMPVNNSPAALFENEIKFATRHHSDSAAQTRVSGSLVSALRTAESFDLESKRKPGLRRRLSRVMSGNVDGFGRSPEVSSSLNQPCLLDDVQTSLVPPNYISFFIDRSPRIQGPSECEVDWAFNAVAFLNNGIRREICDLYKMLSDMERRLLMLTVDDMRIFFTWFQKSVYVLKSIFHLEERSLYAWIEGKHKMTQEARKWEVSADCIKGELSEARRTLKKGELVVLAERVDSDGLSAFVGRPIAEGLVGLAEDIDQFVVALLSYLDAKESILPDIINGTSGLKVKDRKWLENMLWNAMKQDFQSSEDMGLVVIVMTRWMEKKLFWSYRRKYAHFSKRQYDLWRRDFLQGHYSAVQELESRVRPSKLERLKQMEENHRIRALVEPQLPLSPLTDDFLNDGDNDGDDCDDADEREEEEENEGNSDEDTMHTA